MFAYRFPKHLKLKSHWRFNYPNRMGKFSGSYRKLTYAAVCIDLKTNTCLKDRYGIFKKIDKRLLNRLHRKARKSHGDLTNIVTERMFKQL